MTSMKTMTEFVVDVGASMAEDINDGTRQSKLDVIKSFINSFMVRRMIASKTVEFGVTAIGSDRTKNYLSHSQGGGYENVEEVVKMDKGSVEMVRAVDNITVCSSSNITRDLINGIVVAQDVLIRVNHGKAFNRIMVILTDGEMEVDGVEDLETIVAQMQSVVNYGLYVALLGKVKPGISSLVKAENAKLLQSVAAAVGGRFAEVDCVDDCYQLLARAPGLGTRPQLAKITLEIAPNLKVPCVQFSSVMKATAPSIGKQVAGAITNTASVVKRDTTHRNPADLEELVAAEDRLKGYRYGDQYIPMTAEDEAMFRVEGAAGIRIIGSLPAAAIPRHHLLEGSVLLQGAPEVASAQLAVMALNSAMRNDNCAVLVRCTKRDNADPYLGVLLPSCSCTSESFAISTSPASAGGGINSDSENHLLLLHRLPTCEDIRDYSFASLIQFASTAATVDSCTTSSNSSAVESKETASIARKAVAMASFVDALTITQPPPALLSPMNPFLQGIYDELCSSITGKRATTATTSATSARLSSHPVLVHQRLTAKRAIDELYNSFPLQRVDKSRRKKKKEYWSELDIKVTPGLL